MQTLNIYNSRQANKHFSREEKVLGQFFTPPEIAEFIVAFCLKYVSTPKSACDPACGDGVFLSALIKYGLEPLGVDIDENILNFLPEHIKKYVRIENGLTLGEENKFDLVVGNPPFSSKYGRVKGDILKNFELARGMSSQAIEILFLEKFIKLCSNEGVIGIILPQGIFSDIRLSYVRKYISEHLSLIAIFSLPRNIFKSKKNKTSSKTCILIGKKGGTENNQKILFASVDSIEELSKKTIKKKIFAVPQEFLYPEFYLDRNPSLDSLPKLKEFKVRIIHGSAKYGEKRIFSSTGLPFISAKNVTPIGIDFSKDKKFIEPNGIMDNKKAHVKIGDVIFVRVGVGCIGRTAVITKESEKGIVDDWIYIIRSEDKRLSPFYLAFWFQTPTIQKEIRRLARGVGTMTIPITLVKELPIPIPEKDILRKCEEKYYEIILKRENKQEREAYQIKEEICQELEVLFLKNNRNPQRIPNDR
ncbi:MAG: N-6 DNA methylase [candidate division WOR-3 bacterium]